MCRVTEMDKADQQPEPPRLPHLARLLEQQPGFAEVVAQLRAGRSGTFDGAVGSSCALLAASLAHHAPGPLMVVCSSEEAADDLAEDTRLFGAGDAAAFSGLGIGTR